ncbi:MAG: hypothetical protein Q8922_13345 [Bacteroidota bacterium]|nr:hypothetical protein [Bacteroidota bacterium]MDP4233881.1 hypothetical protein [Bacteroidota bacterium]MDP4243554.1 hypothetical protein [Bacteroidota bacterium]MDP4288907.1 hypothetical protein [Bacteroidota bacterium]
MLKRLPYLLGIALFLSILPIRVISQTPDDKADKVERAHRKHVVKKAAADTKEATGKAWSGTKKTARKVYHAPGKAIHKAKVKHRQHEIQEGETK